MARYRIVPEESFVWIDARSSLHPIRARTDGLEGELEVDFTDDGSVDVTMPPKGRLSLAVDRLSSGNALEDAEMKRRVEARRYPTIEGVLSTVRAAGSDQYRVAGDLTFMGVTRPYEDDMTIHVNDADTVSLAGSSTFDVRDFGFRPPRILMLRVHPDVNVRVEIVARRETAS